MSDLLDILTDDEAQLAINATTPPDGLEQMSTAVSRIIDDACGPVVVRTITAELHHGAVPFVFLRHRPVSSVTTVREVPTPGTIDTLSAVAWGAATDGYFAPAWTRDPTLKAGVLYRKAGGVDISWNGADNAVEVTYEAGRYADTATVDERFKTACGAVLRRLWRREAGAWSQSPSFLETNDAQPSSGFYRAVKPIVDELLADEVKARLVGVA